MQQVLFASKPSVVNMQGFLKEGKTGDQMAVSDFEEDKIIFDHSILNKEYSVLTYFVWSFDKYSNLKYKFGQRSFWCRGYYVDTIGKNAKKIAEYVRNQLKEDMMYDQITIKEYKDPFNGS